MVLAWRDCGDTTEAPGVGRTLYVIYSTPHGCRLEVHAKRQENFERILTLGWRPSLESAKQKASEDFLERSTPH